MTRPPRAVRIKEANWKPVWQKFFISDPIEWTNKSYVELRDSMKRVLEGEARTKALERIETLDCNNPDKYLASCDSAAKPPRDVIRVKKKLEEAIVGDADYEIALATELRSLVCTNDDNTIYILGGVARLAGKSSRLAATGREASALVDFIMSKDCPVSAALTGDDKAKLLKIKQDAEKNFPPPLESKQDK